ncbi:hypothetical protein [Aestuariimicrobium kwangyangense]|uniref:hypothetical protein n=1 Tax=Aestuariimicrobium kwangyangense TaxID=396389 RepID=UPI0003B7B0AC|nr:hypothetical protein [Aestuariimicrobium kwangyangense]
MTSTSPPADAGVHVARWTLVRRWAPTLAVWLVALVVLAVAGVGIRANTSVGEMGSTAELPLLPSDTRLPKLARPTSPTESVLVWNRYSTSKSYVTEVTPISVVEGKMSDFRLADPTEVGGMRVFYITYRLTYLRGTAIPGYPDIRLQVMPGKQKAVLPPNGLKDWNQSPCQVPQLRRGFAFGEGTTLTMCSISFVPPGEPTRMMQIEPRMKAGQALSQPNDVRWPLRVS